MLGGDNEPKAAAEIGRYITDFRAPYDDAGAWTVQQHVDTDRRQLFVFSTHKSRRLFQSHSLANAGEACPVSMSATFKSIQDIGQRDDQLAGAHAQAVTGSTARCCAGWLAPSPMRSRLGSRSRVNAALTHIPPMMTAASPR